jgi:hypothetical protein
VWSGTGARSGRIAAEQGRCPRPSGSSIPSTRRPGGRVRPARPGYGGNPRSGSRGPSAGPACGSVAGWVGDRVVVADRSSGGRPAGRASAAGFWVTRAAAGAAGQRAVCSVRRAWHGRPRSVSDVGYVGGARRARDGARGSRCPWLRRIGRAAPASSALGRALGN